MNENRRMTRAAGVVGGATLVSRILGYVRDAVVAWFFGAGLYADAFFVAFRIPNLLRRLFAEGSLSIAFVPVFTETLEKQGQESAFEMAKAAVRLLTLILAVVTVLGIFFAPLIVRVVAPGFGDTPEKFQACVDLTRICFPYIFFIGLVALCMGILNTLGHFLAPALAPVFLNLGMIGGVFLIAPFFEPQVKGLAVGVLVGGGMQLMLQVPFLKRRGLCLWSRGPWFHPALKEVGLLMLPTILGAAVYQVNILVSTFLASFLPGGSVSYLYYADRLVQLPLGVFAVAMATAILPSLSRQAAAGDMAAMKDSFGYALRLILFITLPAMAGLIVLREPIVALLFERGAFDRETTRLTAEALLYYGVGLWAFSAVRIVVSTFYAVKDTRTPVKMAIVSIAVNIALGVILMKPLAHGGLALATSLASMLNLTLLLTALRLRLGRLGLSAVAKSAGRSLLASVVMAMAVWGLSGVLLQSAGRIVGVAALVAIGAGVYALLTTLMKCPESHAILRMAARKR